MTTTLSGRSSPLSTGFMAAWIRTGVVWRGGHHHGQNRAAAALEASDGGCVSAWEGASSFLDSIFPLPDGNLHPRALIFVCTVQPQLCWYPGLLLKQNACAACITHPSVCGRRQLVYVGRRLDLQGSVAGDNSLMLKREHWCPPSPPLPGRASRVRVRAQCYGTGAVCLRPHGSDL